MTRGSAGSMLGVGGTRSNLSRSALRGGRGGRPAGGGSDPQAAKRELLRSLRAAREPAREADGPGDSRGGAQED
ncbi:DUF6243 family protein [Streptomyces sp. bgisy100]|uniref:DUF6243 family protein n=1 Tax=Streptomyces sp. bgisy100 TaxID=3413783 RepID=UPI003D73EF82